MWKSKYVRICNSDAGESGAGSAEGVKACPGVAPVTWRGLRQTGSWNKRQSPAAAPRVDGNLVGQKEHLKSGKKMDCLINRSLRQRALKGRVRSVAHGCHKN